MNDQQFIIDEQQGDGIRQMGGLIAARMRSRLMIGLSALAAREPTIMRKRRASPIVAMSLTRIEANCRIDVKVTHEPKRPFGLMCQSRPLSTHLQTDARNLLRRGC